jgi:uncharacterized protein (TIGR02996 family)
VAKRRQPQAEPSLEAAFVADIAAHPDDDAPRLIFADWLDDHGQPERAQFIRAQCKFDPDRDRLDDPEINTLRDRIEQLRQPYEVAESEWLVQLGSLPAHEYLGWHVLWRRGFVDELEMPVQWIVRHGEQLRQRYPLLRKLTLFRLNGWGQRLAECPCLEGIRELEFPCWYADEDAQALADSPHLRDLERLVYWWDGDVRQGIILARGKAWPNLRNLHQVSTGPAQEWVAAVNEAAGRAIATNWDYEVDLFPFPPDLDLVGKLPDGTQFYIEIEEVEHGRAHIQAFEPDGTPRGEVFTYDFPADLLEPITVDWDSMESRERYWAWEKRRHAARLEHLRLRFGYVPALIRVKRFDFGVGGPFRSDIGVDERWGRPDDPDSEYEEYSPYPAGSFLGMGGGVHSWVSTGSFRFGEGDHVYITHPRR